MARIFERMTRRTARPAMVAVVLGLTLVAQSGADAEVVARKAPAAPAAAAAPAAPAAPARPPSPAPQPTAEDQKFFQAMDQAIQPVRDLTVSADDAKALKEQTAALAAGDYARSRTAFESIRAPEVRAVAIWLKLRSGYGEPAEYREFFRTSPDWPDRTVMVQRMEEGMFQHGGSAKQIKDFFATIPPQTGAGLAALASAELAEGNYAKAKDLARQSWRDLKIPTTLETGFLERFGALIERSDHKFRLDRLLIEDQREASVRAERAGVVRRLIPLLAERERAKAEARLAVFLKSANAAELIAAQSAKMEEGATDYGLVYHRAQTLRRGGKWEEASKLIVSVPTDQRALVNPDPWWEERRLNAYLALDAGQTQLAYDLVKEAGALSVNPLKEQTFIAGWVALRYLNKPELAKPQFEAMSRIVDGPLSKAKAFYWLGRTHEALGNAKDAAAAYRTATTGVDTFHGMLARAKLSPGTQAFNLGFPAFPTPEQQAKFNSNPVVQAAVIAKKAGLETPLVRAITGHLARQALETESETAMVAHLSEAFGDTQQAVRIGKAAIRRGHNLIVYSYPIHAFPAYNPLRDPPELAFLLAVARQETEFNPQTQSGPGAKGLLQVMDITARHVCTQHKLKKCEINRLLADKPYNAMMASAYLGDRMAEFSGSYVLTLAGYNAGPGNARKWMRQFGDPRTSAIDPVDWIERIPFTETREYVAKVLANIQIYRARLGDAPTALRIATDIDRARRADASAAAPLPPAAAAPAPKGAGGDMFEPR
jgi:soluble lytic murein transglycosylase